MFDTTSGVSFHYQCYGQQAYELTYISTDCTAPLVLNYTSTITDSHCAANINCDFVTYSIYQDGITGLQCEDLGEATNSHSELINTCVPAYLYDSGYQRVTCSQTMISTAFYEDNNCSSQIGRVNDMDRCLPNDIIYTDITQCTAPINNIQNQCGYVQTTYNDLLRPLDICHNYKDGGYSYLYTCNKGSVYAYFWYSNNCGDNADAAGNVTVTPMSFSCSTEQCEYSMIRWIQNNECEDVSMKANTYFNYVGVITNKCFNWFEDDTSMKSKIYHCNDTVFIGIEYDTADCTGSEGRITELYTETCSLSDEQQYRFECFDDSNISYYEPTSAPFSTVNPTEFQSTRNILTLFTTQHDELHTTNSIAASTINTTPSPTEEHKRILYVSKSGLDTSWYCYPDACGTLRKAVVNILKVLEWNSFSSVTDWEIIVRGQNTEEFAYWLSLGVNPCKPFWSSRTARSYWDTWGLTITFDPEYIHSMNDWYDTDLCEDSVSTDDGDFFSTQIYTVGVFTLIFNNLVIDSYIFEGRESQPFYIANVEHFICNNCTFANITINSNHASSNAESALIFAENAEFYDCMIENITYIAVSDDDSYDYSFVFLDSEIENVVALKITDSIMHGISMLNAFARIYDGSSLYSVYVNISISNVMFYDIFVIDAIFYHYSSSAIAYISITESNFYNMQFGSIFHETDFSKSYIDITDVNISTDLTISQYFNQITHFTESYADTEHPSALFIFESSASSVSIKRVNIEYIYSEFIEEHCVSDYSISDMIYFYYSVPRYTGVDLGFLEFTYKCDAPVEFIYSQSVINIEHVSVRNDVTDAVIQAFRDNVFSSVNNLSPWSQDTIYVNFVFWDEEERDDAFIYNDGTLDIDSLLVLGSGMHHYLIISPSGDLTVNNLLSFPESYCVSNDDKCEYDPDALHINYWIAIGVSDAECSNTELVISNSYIYGAKWRAITIGTGYATLENVTIEKAASAMSTDKDVMQLSITSCKFMDIGSYYASSTFLLNAYWPLFTPMLLVPVDLYIQDSIFSYVNPFQFDIFDPQEFDDRGYLSDDVVDTRKITLINNHFEINDENVVTSYPINHSGHYLDDVEWGRSTYDVNYTVYVDLSQYFLLNATMNFPEKTQVTMINNIFTMNEGNIYVNDSILIDNNIAWVSVENKDVTHCMSGNEFSNFAVWVKEGNITSCFRNEMIDYFDVESCNEYGTFGAISDLSFEGKRNVFNVTNDEIFIMKVEQDAFIALDNNIINIYNDKYRVDILNILSGNYLLTDIEMNIVEYDITVHQDCDIHCYSLWNNDTKRIPVLHITCDDITNTYTNTTYFINDLYNAEMTTAFTPYSIKITTQENASYFPGDKLLLNYFIFDAEDNEINQVNQDIVVYYESDAIVFQLNIDSDGVCMECIHGVSFPAISLEDTGTYYSFNGRMENNYLIIEDTLNFTVSLCPSGYGSTGTLQCDLCSKGFVNLLPTNASCTYCDENELDGISCPGYNNIIVYYNYWAAVNGYNAKQNIFGTDNDAYIVSGNCPNAYCCQSTAGCDIIHDDDILCAANRDRDTVLCGQCLSGYAELFGSVTCAKCSRNYWERLLLPIFYGLLWSAFILFTTQQQNTATQQNAEDKTSTCTNNSHAQETEVKNDSYKMSRSDYLDCTKIMATKILIYYYQSISYILTINGATTTLYGFVNLFNLDIFSLIGGGNNNNTGFCLFQNMSTPQKISLPLVSTASILFFIFLSYLCSICSPINICCGRAPNFAQAFIKAALITVGQLLSVLFTLLSCRKVGDVDVHYFFGSQQCFGDIWIVSLLSLCFIVVCFFALFIYIWIQKRNSDTKDDKNSTYYPVIKSFKQAYWWWECILFLRRCIFALVFIVIDNNDFKLCICILSLMYLPIQSNYAPFKWKHANRFESYLIVSICIIIFVDISAYNEIFRDVVLSLLILLPLMCFIYFIIANCASLKNKDNDNTSEIAHKTSGTRSDCDGMKSDVDEQELVTLERGTAGGHSARL